MLASNRVECCPERFQMQAATAIDFIANTLNITLENAQLWVSTEPK